MLTACHFPFRARTHTHRVTNATDHLIYGSDTATVGNKQYEYGGWVLHAVTEANKTVNDYNSVMTSKLHCTSNIIWTHMNYIGTEHTCYKTCAMHTTAMCYMWCGYEVYYLIIHIIIHCLRLILSILLHDRCSNAKVTLWMGGNPPQENVWVLQLHLSRAVSSTDDACVLHWYIGHQKTGSVHLTDQGLRGCGQSSQTFSQWILVCSLPRDEHKTMVHGVLSWRQLCSSPQHAHDDDDDESFSSKIKLIKHNND